jgi:hypothetical protein
MIPKPVLPKDIIINNSLALPPMLETAIIVEKLIIHQIPEYVLEWDGQWESLLMSSIFALQSKNIETYNPFRGESVTESINFYAPFVFLNTKEWRYELIKPVGWHTPFILWKN